MRAFARLLFGRRARRRWIHLVLGGALAMPYVLVGELVLGSSADGVLGPMALAAFAVGLPVAAVTALFPLTRPLEAGAVRWLCGIDADSLAYGPARGRGEKARTALWFTLHLGLGGIVAGMTLAVPPLGALLLALPFLVLSGNRLGLPEFSAEPWLLALCPFLGVAVLLVPACCAAGSGALLARWAPALLGPSAEDRLAAAEARAADLAVRNRLARELHDSVGHALSAVMLQASAARRVLDADPDFAREALAAIEDTTRRTVGELDAVLGVLRDGDAPGTAPAPTLESDLDGLLRRTRAGGLEVTATIAAGIRTGGRAEDGTGPLPPLVSREAYRIVQEGLSNALKHAGGRVAVDLRLGIAEDHLEITVANPLDGAGAATATRPGGGHGLRGIADRARLLGGTATAGPAVAGAPGEADAAGGWWRLHVRLPMKGPV